MPCRSFRPAESMTRHTAPRERTVALHMVHTVAVDTEMVHTEAAWT